MKLLKYDAHRPPQMQKGLAGWCDSPAQLPGGLNAYFSLFKSLQTIDAP
jgi:hypothetical protein